ncbi:MAG: zinc ribbon domain-containing protein [Anaerolineales bacterium]|nr:MAG: zinc ribbon domain-containing protein [Anaerolineales bacterium]
MQSLNCPNCGAAIPPKAIKASDLVTCEFCGTSFRVPKTLTPEPDMGDLILGADFSSKVMPGWEVINEQLLTFHKGKPSELRGSYKPQINTYYVLKSSGFLDDFDASINIKYTDGVKDIIRAGFYLRFTDEGGYAVLVSVIGSYSIGYYKKDQKGELKWEDLLPWANHTALRSGMNETNRLRVICQGEKFRVYLNGVLATSFKDSVFKRGKLYLAVVPTEKSNLDVTFTDLQLREVLK